MQRLLIRFPARQTLVRILRSKGTLSSSSLPKILHSQPTVMSAAVSDHERAFLEREGAETFENVQFDVFPGWDNANEEFSTTDDLVGSDPADQTLQDVIELVRAPEAWRRTRGEGATIVVVDTGISASLRELPPLRRSGLDMPSAYSGQHWEDTRGHGSMCAAIAAGSKDGGGRYDGIAPGACVMSARSNLTTTDLTEIYDGLIRLKAEGQLGGPVVISNSLGLSRCEPSVLLRKDHPIVSTMIAAVDAGLFFCFAAGNNHCDKCGHDPNVCGPNTIWGLNSHDRIVSVGTVDNELTNCNPLSPHKNSSRGPGEWAETTVKPDCVAPTFGEVPCGGTLYRRMRWWGTSGACPQVAGLAALIFSLDATLSPAEVGGIILDTCNMLPEGRTCVGSGVIDCEAAVETAAHKASGSNGTPKTA
jgi:serine protease AprX